MGQLTKFQGLATQSFRVAGLIIGTCLACGAMAQAKAFDISYEPIWPKLGPGQFAVPVKLNLKCNTADTMGMVVVRGLGSAVSYPIELPRGTTKSITVYVEGTQWSTPTAELQTPMGNQSKPIELQGPSGDANLFVGVISSTPGLLASLTATKTNGAAVLETGVKPESAPDRSVGYRPLKTVVLAEGAERLSDGAVWAIQRYVLAGGTLLVTGGASAPWLRDSRWAPVLPMAPGQVREVSVQGKIGSEELTAPLRLTVSGGVPTPGASVSQSSEGVPLIVSKSIGLGKVVVWTFDPFVAPLQTHQARNAMIRTLVKGSADGSAILDRYRQNDDPNRTMYAGNSQNPFKVTMPPTGLIVAILCLFLVFAIPVNFVVLNKLNKRELAWVTIPLASLVFSGLIFASARNLYSVGEARRTNGLLLTHEGTGQATFVGRQELFLPKAGLYDMGYQSVESASNNKGYEGGFSGEGLFSGQPEFIDVGQVVAPRIEANNLTFRDTELVQAVPFQGKLVLRPTMTSRNGSVIVTGRITNDTPYFLYECHLSQNGLSGDVQDLRPGQSATIRVVLTPSSASRKTSVPNNGVLYWSSGIEGVSIGTPLGNESKAWSNLSLLYSWNLGVQQ
ncbi:MAG: hypothetical protein JNM34_12165 [Chthonomonadaceae bacterium]|nr:hypothetical protein [Chthonomonadaceae bacterium]